MSAGGTMDNGCDVMFHSKRSVSCEMSENTATFHTAGRVIIVGPKDITIDGLKQATLCEAKSVVVNVRGERIILKVDGQTLAEWIDE